MFKPWLSGNFGILTAPFPRLSLTFLPHPVHTPSYHPLFPQSLSPIDTPYLPPFIITPSYLRLKEFTKHTANTLLLSRFQTYYRVFSV